MATARVLCFHGGAGARPLGGAKRREAGGVHRQGGTLGVSLFFFGGGAGAGPCVKQSGSKKGVVWRSTSKMVHTKGAKAAVAFLC